MGSMRVDTEMSNRHMTRRSRVLMFSQRNIYEIEVWRSTLREFEEIIRDIDSVELLAPQPRKWFEHRTRIAQTVGKHSSLVLNPGLPKIKLDRYYDLFFAICEKPSELLNVNAAEGWSDYCKTSICLLSELWIKQMPLYKSSLKVLSKFDYVFSFLSQSVEPINQATRAKCFYMPPGVDTVLFLPYPKAAKRFIDIFSLGRRSEQVHQALLTMARNNEIFYVYDTIKDLHTHNLEEHRFLIANMANRSRYFVVNPAKSDRPAERGDQSEMGFRYFEGAAAGTIMIGEQPTNHEFKKEFFWPDAVVQLPYDSGRIQEVIREIDQQPDRQEKIRNMNMVQALLRHDWLYRWETVLKTAGLEPMPELVKRKRMLLDLSKMTEEQTNAARIPR